VCRTEILNVMHLIMMRYIGAVASETTDNTSQGSERQKDMRAVTLPAAF